MQIIRLRSDRGDISLGLARDGRLVARFGADYPTLATLLRLPADRFRTVLETAATPALPFGGESRGAAETLPLSGGESRAKGSILAPIDGNTEVWAAGVTYKRSEEARLEESGTPDIYTRVYTAERPELFFKATPGRVAGPDAPIVVRADSSWDVPEPELALIVNAHAEIVGYCIGNDVSSRSIEGENPLYLPQAKVYAGCCALGPGITPAWEVPDPYNLTIRMSIERGGKLHWAGETSSRELKRRLDELVSYLFREDEFPEGVVLLTGTCLVPDTPFTLQPGDAVEIAIEPLGTLHNTVVRGKARLRRLGVPVEHVL